MSAPQVGEWVWKVSAGVGVGAGEVGSDSGSWVGVSEIGVADLDGSGVDRSGMLGGIVAGQEILFWGVLDSSVWSRWKVLAAGVDNSGYWVFSVSFLEGAGVPGAVSFGVLFEVGEPVPPDAPEGFRWVERWVEQVSGGAVEGEAWVVCTDHSMLHWSGSSWEEIDKVPPSLAVDPGVAPTPAQQKKMSLERAARRKVEGPIFSSGTSTPRRREEVRLHG